MFVHVLLHFIYFRQKFGILQGFLPVILYRCQNIYIWLYTYISAVHLHMCYKVTLVLYTYTSVINLHMCYTVTLLLYTYTWAI